MKKVLILLLFAGAFALYWFKFRGNDAPEGPRQQPLTTKRHSDPFNKTIDSLLQQYFVLTEAFVNADSAAAKQQSMNLEAFINRMNVEELKKDTAGIYQTAVDQLASIKANLESMGRSQTITDMRHDLKDLSENLYPLIKTIHYEGQKLYWQNCGMPFGENTSANWISNTPEIINPYLGKNHPEHQSDMLHCGDTQDSIIAL